MPQDAGVTDLDFPKQCFGVEKALAGKPVQVVHEGIDMQQDEILAGEQVPTRGVESARGLCP